MEPSEVGRKRASRAGRVPGPGRWLVRLAVVLLACLPSLGTLEAPWISDDAVILGHVHREGAVADWSGPQYQLLTIRFWRPLVSGSWALQQELFGVDPFPFRLLNLLAHALAALLVAELAVALGCGALGALVAGALAAVFPEQGGTVTWVAGRVDSLTLPFFVGALVAVLAGRAWLAALAAFAACACKETAFALPALAFVLLCVAGPGAGRGMEGGTEAGTDEERALRRRRWRAGALLFVAVLLAFVWRRAALGAWIGGYPRTAVGPWSAAANVGRALVSASWPSLTGVLLLALTGILAGVARRRVLSAALVCAVLAAAPLFALLTDGVLEEPNRRTLAFFDLGLCLAAGAAVAGWREPRAGAPSWAGPALLGLALFFVAWRTSLAWKDTHEWAVAGEVAAQRMEQARREAERSGAGRLPLLAEGLPRIHGGAYALAWGVVDRTRAPFPPTPRPVWPLRPLFGGLEAVRLLPAPTVERFGNSVLASDSAADALGSLRVGADGFGPLGALAVDARVPLAEPDRSDAFVFELEATLPAWDGLELVLYTELGYQAFGWEPARSRISLMEAFALSNGSVTMGDVWILAASTGAERAYLELRAWRGQPENAVARSRWIELRWERAVLDLLR